MQFVVFKMARNISWSSPNSCLNRPFDS